MLQDINHPQVRLTSSFKNESEDKSSLSNVLRNLEQKQITDQNVFMRKLKQTQELSRFYCILCLLNFESQEALNLHNEQHFLKENVNRNYVIPKYSCPLCKKSFQNKNSYHEHLLDKSHANSNILQPVVSLQKDASLDNLAKISDTKSISSSKCIKCTKKFLKFTIFERHKQFHRLSSVYECPNCFKPLDSIKKIIRHKSMHLKKERNFECFSCKKEFSKYVTLLSHFESSVCNWKKISKKKGHKKESTTTVSSKLGMREVICQICFTKSENILQHVKTHKSGFSYECFYCLKGFNDYGSMKKHKDAHQPNRFECRNCNTDFNSYEDLVLHHNSCKPKPDENAIDTDNQSTVDLSVSCQVCFKKILTPSLLSSHLKLHTTGEKYECCFCFIGFDDEEELQEHKMTHDTKKPFQCKICRHKFKNSSELMSHFMESKHKDISSDTSSHSKFDPVPLQVINSADVTCSVCQARFTAPTKARIKESFDNHAKFHSKLFPFECPFCYTGFISLYELKIHKKSHITSGKKYTCTVCNFVSDNFAHFRNHLEVSDHRNNYIKELLKLNTDHNSKKITSNETESDSDFNLSQNLSRQESLNMSIVSPKLRFECPLCEVNLGCNRESFDTHIKLHRRPFVKCCKYCLKEFKSFDEIDEHIKDNHKDKLFSCPYNDFTSDTHSSVLLHFELKHHESLHEEDLKKVKVLQFENKSYGQDGLFEVNKYQKSTIINQQFQEHSSNNSAFKSKEIKSCQICFMELEGERSLKSHQKIHMTGFPLECSQCLMGFVDENKLIKHRKLHMEYFECLYCSEEFDTYTRFIKHLDDTNHNTSYKNSYEKHSSLVPKVLHVVFKDENDYNIIQDLTETIDIKENLPEEDSDLLIDEREFNLKEDIPDIKENFTNVESNFLSEMDSKLNPSLEINDELCNISCNEEKDNEEKPMIDKPCFSDSDEDFNLSRINFEYKSFSDSSQDLFNPIEKQKEKTPTVDINEEGDNDSITIDDQIDTIVDTDNSEKADLTTDANCESSFMNVLISKRKEYIEKIFDLVSKQSSKGVTYDFIEAYFCTGLETDHFKHSLHSYVEAAIFHGKIRKEVKDGEDVYFTSESKDSKVKIIACGYCSACLKNDCGNCKTCIHESVLKDKSKKKRCLRKRCLNIKKIKKSDTADVKTSSIDKNVKRTKDDDKELKGLNIDDASVLASDNDTITEKPKQSTLNNTINTILSEALHEKESIKTEEQNISEEQLKSFKVDHVTKTEIDIENEDKFDQQICEDMKITSEDLQQKSELNILKKDETEVKINSNMMTGVASPNEKVLMDKDESELREQDQGEVEERSVQNDFQGTIVAVVHKGRDKTESIESNKLVETVEKCNLDIFSNKLNSSGKEAEKTDNIDGYENICEVGKDSIDKPVHETEFLKFEKVINADILKINENETTELASIIPKKQEKDEGVMNQDTRGTEKKELELQEEKTFTQKTQESKKEPQNTSDPSKSCKVESNKCKKKTDLCRKRKRAYTKRNPKTDVDINVRKASIKKMRRQCASETSFKAVEKSKSSTLDYKEAGNSLTSSKQIIKTEGRIPIYKKEVLKNNQEEHFSDYFVNRNILLKNKQKSSQHRTTQGKVPQTQRKFIERRKFGSLNTKFTGRKSISTNISFEKDDPFSLEVEDIKDKEIPDKGLQDISKNRNESVVRICEQSEIVSENLEVLKESNLKKKQSKISMRKRKAQQPSATKQQLSIHDESVTNIEKILEVPTHQLETNTNIQLRKKEVQHKIGEDSEQDIPVHINDSEITHETFEAQAHQQESTTNTHPEPEEIDAHENEIDITESKAGKLIAKKKKKRDKKRESREEKMEDNNIDPSCPYCFKLLLNPEKMRLHIANCEKGPDSVSSFKFKIQLNSESSKIRIKDCDE